MNVLIVYSRDVDINDSGGARTVIELANYLSNQEDCKCFCSFRILDGNRGNIIEIPIDKSRLVVSYNNILVKKSIDCIIVPEGYMMTGIIAKAAKGTNCKIVSAMHNKPGYERCRLYIQIIDSLLYNESIIKRIRALCILLVYPLFYYLWTRNIMRKMRDGYNKSDRFVLLSNKFFDSFIEKYNIKDEGIKLSAIANGLSFDPNCFSKEKFSKKEKVCLVVSRFDERAKRLSMVFRIWKELEPMFPDWNLEIVGFGRSEPLYQRLVKKYNLKKVTFAGKQAPMKYYEKAKLFFMTSAFEGFGMTLTEAQQMGCVPIAIDSFASVRDIITDGFNGYIASNEGEFISKASELMRNTEKVELMAINAIDSSKRFERHIIYGKYYELVKKLHG